MPRFDIVIANAGISAYFGKATETPAKQMTEYFSVNTIGSLLLFQATVSLLHLAERPKFIALSSGAGSIDGMEALKDVQNTAYGASKAALNFVVRKIHFENPGLIAFSVNPGWLQTDVRHSTSNRTTRNDLLILH
jgi:norsolorinic acid ketoreductase